MDANERILLSPPDVGQRERELLLDAFDSNWIAPLGPHVDGFEAEFAARLGVPAAHAVNSGTAALHLALRLVGVEKDDEVLVSSFTFAGSVYPVVYLGARPTFVDSEGMSWNMDPDLLTEVLEDRARAGRLPAAVVVVHLYGQAADMVRIQRACARFEVPLVEDAAEALGATHDLGAPGTLGRVGIFSFNGNKMITTSGGGMLVSHDAALVERARKLSAQAKEAVGHYEHMEVGYNYRLSNLLAALGRAQLERLDDRVAKRRRNFDEYRRALDGMGGIQFQKEAPWGRHSRWLTCLTLSPDRGHPSPEEICASLDGRGVEARRLWKPMHMQPVFRDCAAIGGGVAEALFSRGLCLPSGSALQEDDRARVVEALRDALG